MESGRRNRLTEQCRAYPPADPLGRKPGSLARLARHLIQGVTPKGRSIMTNRNLRSAAIMIISELGKAREEATDKTMAKLFPDEPTRLQPGDWGRLEEGDFAAMMRICRIGVTKEVAALEDMDDDRLAKVLKTACYMGAMLDTVRMLAYEQKASEAARRESAKKASDARHAEDREIAERIKAWYADSYHLYRSMDKAADDAVKLEPVAWRTARKHIGAAAKNLHSARKA